MKSYSQKSILLLLLIFAFGLFFLQRHTDNQRETLPESLAGVEGEPGDRIAISVGEVKFYLRLAPARSFPTGVDDTGVATVDYPFYITETLVTYALWTKVRIWGEENGYTFANEGRQGSSYGSGPVGNPRHPVTTINWRDCIVWCNALSQYLGLEPVYTYDGEPLRDATLSTACDNAIQEDQSGFRLPTSSEWELAARYQPGDPSHGAIAYPEGSNHWWTPGRYASGAKDHHQNATATGAAAWYEVNSGQKTQEVGLKPASGNGLGLFDMSGNVWEWCFTPQGMGRISRGGSWNYFASHLQVGFFISDVPGNAYYNYGFRLVKNLQ